MCCSMKKSGGRGPAVQRGQQGDTPRAPDIGRQGCEDVEKGGRCRDSEEGNRAVVRWMGRGEGTGATFSFLQPLVRGWLLVESAWRLLLCFLKIILMIHALNYIPMPRGPGWGARLFEKSNK